MDRIMLSLESRSDASETIRMTGKIKPGISIVVPVFNSCQTIPDLVERVTAAADGLRRPYEIILVNDGSADESWDAIQEQARKSPAVRGVNLMRNYGQHNALLCGIRRARFDVTVTLDDDLQNPPEEMARLVEELDQGFDVVYGVPRRSRHSLGHVIAGKLLRLMLWGALGARTTRISSSFRAFRTRLRRAFDHSRSPLVVIDIYLTWGTSRFGAVTVHHEERAEGPPGYSLRKRFAQALDIITGFSTLPLKIASVAGFCFTLFGVGVLIYVLAVFVYYRGETVPGFAFLASTIAIFSGAQLFALGIMGEYMSRMFHRLMDRPAYAVRDSTQACGPDGKTQDETAPE